MERTKLADGTLIFREGSASTRLKRLAPGLLFVQVAGAGAATIDLTLLEELTAEIEQVGRLELFCDLRSQKRMLRETRDASAEWAKKYKSSVKTHVLVGSRFMEMAISVISMVSGIVITTYTKHDRFTEALRKHSPHFKIPAAPAA